MSPNRRIFGDHYTHGKPFVEARLVVINPTTLRQTTITRQFWIDTGFNGGAHVADVYVQEISQIGVSPRLGPVGLAGGISKPGHFCVAYLQQIGDYEFPAPGIEATLILQGSSNHGLLGLEVLNHFVAKFDGPNQSFVITSE
jgi:hypothetical protein